MDEIAEGLRPTIEDARRIQRERGLLDTHLCYLDSAGFVIAHTDPEREASNDLATCPLHQWLHGLDEQPAPDGWYEAHRHQPDAYSASLGDPLWDFLPLELTEGSEGRG